MPRRKKGADQPGERGRFEVLQEEILSNQKLILDGLKAVNERMDRLEHRIGVLEHRFSRLEQRIERMELEIQRVQLAVVETRHESSVSQTAWLRTRRPTPRSVSGG